MAAPTRRKRPSDPIAPSNLDNVDHTVLEHQVRNLVLKNAYNNAQITQALTQQKVADKNALDLNETVAALELDAKFATASVNTQYQMLQRLFILRANENRNTIIKLTRELEAVKAETSAQLSQRDRLLSEKDARIEQLETFLKMMHIQMTGVCLDTVNRLENVIIEAIESAQNPAEELHRQFKEELMNCGFTTQLI